MYDLKNPLVEVNSAAGCDLAQSCPSCSGNGYCEPQMNKASYCVCDLGKTGKNCNESKYSKTHEAIRIDA